MIAPMGDLQKLINKHGDINKFIEETQISRCFFYEWRKGKKGMSLKMATRIVENSKGAISYEDLANFEKMLQLKKNEKQQPPA
jgi:hypothetical protein